jgi:hypothetical protein
MAEDDVPSDFTQFADMADDIGLPIFGARVLVFINTEGVTDVTWAWEGDNVASYVATGALESMKMELFHNHSHGLRKFDDPDA